MSLLVGSLQDEAGNTVGKFNATKVVLGGGLTLEVTCLEHHVFELGHGRLFGSGVSTRGREVVDDFCVSGGAGAFSGAYGSYTFTHDDLHMGGTGSAQFDFRLMGRY